MQDRRRFRHTKFDIIKFMYRHLFFLKSNFNHFQRYSLSLNKKSIRMLIIIFNIQIKSSTTFGYKNEIFMKIRFFPFYIFYSQYKMKSNFGKRVAGAHFHKKF